MWQLALGQISGRAWSAPNTGHTVDAPILDTIEPVTNPPNFNASLTVVGAGAVLVADVIRLRIDGGTTYDSAPLTPTDLMNGYINITSATLTPGSHNADAAVIRASVQVSDWSNLETFVVPSGGNFVGGLYQILLSV